MVATTIQLLPMTEKHQALLAYDHVPSTPFSKRPIVLCTRVTDGIGDLEHLIRAGTRLIKFRNRHGDFRIFAWIERSTRVPDGAWDAKLALIHKLGLNGVFSVADRIPHSSEAAHFKTQMPQFCQGFFIKNLLTSE
jgi:hypothetical protein